MGFTRPEMPSAPPFKLIAKIVGGVVGGILALSVVLGSYYTVNAGHRGIQTRFGAVSRITGQGFHFKMPFVDSVEQTSVRTVSIDWRHDGKNDYRMEAYSHDRQPANMSVKVSYHIKDTDEGVREFYLNFKTRDSLESSIIIPRASKAVKTTFGQFTSVSVIQERVRFNSEARDAVQAAIDQGIDGGKKLPIVIDGVDVYDITFSPAYIHAVEDRMKAEVEVAKVAQTLERERTEATIKVVQAQGEADSNLARAKARAKAIELEGAAQAAAIHARGAALRDNPSLVSLTAVEKWNGILPQTMVPGSTVPFIGVK